MTNNKLSVSCPAAQPHPQAAARGTAQNRSLWHIWRSLWLAVGLVVVSVVGAGWAVAAGAEGQGKAPAADIPCPADQLVQKSREQNQARGKMRPEEFYSQLRQNYQNQCAAANKAIAELAPKLKEYEEGKRGDQDGFVILRGLAWQYKVLRAETSDEGKRVADEFKALGRKHPEFSRLQSNELSEDLQGKRNTDQQLQAEQQVTSKWVPSDADPIGEYQAGSKRIVVYQYRMEFFSGQNKPSSVLTFKYPITVYPKPLSWTRDSGSNLLVCTRRHAGYEPRNEQEQKMVRLRGYHRGWMPWINPAGTRADFCGIVSSAGSIVYAFPPANPPSRIYSPIGVADGGKRAAVLVGQLVHKKATLEDDSEEHDAPGNFSSILVWQYPDKLRKAKVGPGDLWGNKLVKRLRDDKL